MFHVVFGCLGLVNNAFLTLVIDLLDILNEVIPTNHEEEVNAASFSNFMDNVAPQNQDANANEKQEFDEIDEIDVILNTVMQRLRRLEDNNENSVDQVVRSVLDERNSRVKRKAINK